MIWESCANSPFDFDYSASGLIINIEFTDMESERQLQIKHLPNGQIYWGKYYWAPNTELILGFEETLASQLPRHC